MLGFGVIGVLIVGEIGVRVVYPSGIAATAVAASIVALVGDGLTGVNATGSSQAFVDFQNIENLRSVFGTGIITEAAPSLTDQILVGVNSSGIVQSFAILLPETLTGVFGAGNSGAVTPESFNTVNLSGINASGAARAITPEIDLAPAGVFGSGVTAVLTISEVVAFAGINATGQVGTLIQTDTESVAGVFGSGAISGFGIEIDVPIVGVSGTGIATKVLVPIDLNGINSSGIASALPVEIDPTITAVNATSVARGFTEVDPSLTLPAIFATGITGMLVPTVVLALTAISSTGASAGLISDPSAQISGIAGQGSAAAVVISEMLTVGNIFATGNSGSFGLEIDVPLPSVFATGTFHPFGTNFFDGVAAFGAFGSDFIEDDHFQGGTFATGMPGNAAVQDSPVIGAIYGTGLVGALNPTDNIIIASSVLATASTQTLAIITNPSLSGTAGVGTAAVMIEIDTGLVGAPSTSDAGIIIADPGPYGAGVFSTGLTGSLADGIAFGFAEASTATQAASFAGALSKPIVSASATGVVVAAMFGDLASLSGVSGIGFVNEIVQPGSILGFGTSATSAANAFMALDGVALISVNAIGAISTIVGDDLLGGGAAAQGQSQTIALIDGISLNSAPASGQVGTVLLSPTLISVSGSGLSGQIGMGLLLAPAIAIGQSDSLVAPNLLTLNGINAAGIASGIEATITLASAIATAEAQPLPYLYSTMIGVSAIGGSALVTIFSVLFDTNNAIIVHGAGSASIVANGNELVISIIGGASKNLPPG